MYLVRQSSGDYSLSETAGPSPAAPPWLLRLRKLDVTKEVIKAEVADIRSPSQQIAGFSTKNDSHVASANVFG